MKKILVILTILALMSIYSNGFCAFQERPAVVGDIFEKGRSGYDVRSYGATGDGSTDDSTAFTNAIAAAAGGRVIVSEARVGSYKISSNVTVPSGVTIVFRQGGVLSVDTSITFTIAQGATLIAGEYQIMSGAGTLALGAGVCDYTLPQWWGAVGDNSTSCHDAFESAITAAQNIGICFIPSGTYVIEDTILKFTDTEGYCLKVTPSDPLASTGPSTGTIKDMHIQCPNIPDIDSGGAVLLNTAYWTVRNVTFTGSTNATAVTIRSRWIPQSESSMTNDTDRDFTTTGAGATEKYAIKFTTQSRASWIRSVTVRLGKTGAPAGTIQAEIWSDNAGSPDAIIDVASDTVSCNSLSAAADGADQQFVWSSSTDRPDVVASTDYWLVLATTGYTYTDTTTRLRVDAGDGAVNGFSTYDFGGGSWSESDDGANYTVNVLFGQPLDNRIITCYAQSRTTLGRFLDVEDNSVVFMDGGFYAADVGIDFDAQVLLMDQVYIFTTTRGLNIKSTYTGLNNCYSEGKMYFASKGENAGNRTNIFGGLMRGDITWEEGIKFNDYSYDLFQYSTDDPAFIPRLFTYNIVTATNSSWLKTEHSTSADVDALDGTAMILDAVAEKASLSWSVSSGLGFLGKLPRPRGSYLITYWVKDTNQVANDFTLDSLADDGPGGFDTLATKTYTLTADYAPYYILHRLTSTYVGASADMRSRVRGTKATAGANTISVSHATIEYLGPDIVNDRNMVLFSNDQADTDGARQISTKYMGQQSGGEQSMLAEVRAAHDGAADDEKGKLEIYTNDGSDGFAPTKRLSVDNAGAIDFTSSNITYVPLSGDIQTYVTAAAAGDTLVLSSGTYTITSTITVNKRLTIRGQGRAGSSLIPLTPVHGTTISCATAAVTAFAITSDDVLISDLSINMTGAGSTGVSVAMDTVRPVLENIYVYINSTGLNTGFNVYSSNIVLRDLAFYIISTDGSAAGVFFYNDSSSTINATLDAFSVTGTSVGNTGYSYAFACYNNNDANTLRMNLTNCLGTASGGTVADWAVISTSTTTFNSTVYAYNCILDGADFDAVQSGTNVLDVGGSTLLNETISGTIIQAGMIRINTLAAANISVNELDKDGITTNVPSTTQAITAVGDTILANAGLVVLNPDADYILTSTPTVADGTIGEVFRITCANGETNTITIQDETELGGSNLRLKGDTLEITGKTVSEFVFDGTDWVESPGQVTTEVTNIRIKNLTIEGPTILDPSSTQVIDAAGDSITADATLVILNPDADYILTSTPTIADGTTGQILLISCDNAESNTVTLQDAGLLGSSNLRLKSSTSTVVGKKAISFVFDGTEWVETGQQDIGTAQALIYGPGDINDQIPMLHVDAEKYPRGIIMMNVQITLPVDTAYSMPFEEWSGDPPAAQADIETVTTTGSDAYMEVRTTDIDNRTVDADDYIFLDIPATASDWIMAAVFFYSL
jgi:hypothetical protein